MFGLPEKTINQIINYFQTQHEIMEVRVYGSRAMGTGERGSDIDLAIFTSSEKDRSGRVKTDLEGLSTPYMFDITDYTHISHPGLKQHIDRVGKVLFKRKTE